MSLIVYYLLMPFLAAGLLIRWLKKHAPPIIAEDIRQLSVERPIEKKWFRAVRRDHKSLRWLGDFEKQPEAVEAAYQGLKDARQASEKASFLVLNDKGETLEQVDA